MHPLSPETTNVEPKFGRVQAPGEGSAAAEAPGVVQANEHHSGVALSRFEVASLRDVVHIPGGGLHSFRSQLNLCSSAYRVTRFNS
jgi:hypothetical protein